MPKPNQYVVKMINKHNTHFGQYYSGFMRWSEINEAVNYDDDYVESNLSLNSSHELLKVEQDGRLTHIR